jgi:TBCC domain-containing protein 1
MNNASEPESTPSSSPAPPPPPPPSSSHSFSPKHEHGREPHPSPSKLLFVRREPFEYGLLPLPSIIFSDPASSLQALRSKVLASSNLDDRAASATNLTLTSHGVAQLLDLSDEEAELVLETLISVQENSKLDRNILPSSSSSCIDTEKQVEFYDLLLFLYIQNYKKPPIRPHKDAASVADIWPSTSAFDGLMPILSPLQVNSGSF